MGRCVHSAQLLRGEPVQLRDLLKPELASFEFLIESAFKAAAGSGDDILKLEPATIPGRIGDQLKNVINYLEFLACSSKDENQERDTQNLK